MAHASSSTEAVRIDQIDSAVVTRVIAEPAQYSPAHPPSEVVLTLGWVRSTASTSSHARCSDPNCEADHGYTGTSANDDFTVRVSAAADGADVVAQALEFRSGAQRGLRDRRTQLTGPDAGLCGPEECRRTHAPGTRPPALAPPRSGGYFGRRVPPGGCSLRPLPNRISSQVGPDHYSNSASSRSDDG